MYIGDKPILDPNSHQNSTIFLPILTPGLTLTPRFTLTRPKQVHRKVIVVKDKKTFNLN